MHDKHWKTGELLPRRQIAERHSWLMRQFRICALKEKACEDVHIAYIKMGELYGRRIGNG